MRFPTLTPGPRARRVTEVFRGYDSRLHSAEGSFRDTRNLTSDHFPLLASRRPRGLCGTLTRPGGLIGRDALCHVADGALYVNGAITPLTGITEGEKRLVGMGAYILVFPDKLYYNTEDPSDFGAMEADVTVTGEFTYTPCDLDGRPYTVAAVGLTEPDSPQNGDCWLDAAAGRLQQYSAAAAVWTPIETVYTRVDFPSAGTLPAAFREGDGVEISGLAGEALNGTKYLYGLGGGGNAGDWLILVGLVGAAFTQSGTARLRRRLPDMDFVIECQNRLWGCKYGLADGEPLNELYCSALGDFKNWRQYQGLSTDSWTASVGSDGAWTGAVNYRGHPVFFKEERIHTVTVSPLGAHRVDETVCRGVQKGSGKSLVVVGETLFYKSRAGVCAWQGGFPESVSAPLGDGEYFEAAGGALGGKYYLSMRDGAGAWSLFVYDTEKDLWLREDELHAVQFAQAGGELWCLDADGRLLAMTGSQGERESVAWSMETGTRHYEQYVGGAGRQPVRYLSRYDIRLALGEGASAAVFFEYDSSGVWVESGRVTRAGTGAALLPVRPRRCEHLRMKISGTGEVKIFSIARTMEVGSDV